MLRMGVLCLLTQVFVSHVAIANDPVQWVATSPGGGGCFRGVAISPHDSDLIFCNNDMGGAFRSEDGGETWTLMPFAQIHSVLTSGNYPQAAWSFHPTIESRVLVGTNDGFLISDDKGLNWKRIPGILERNERGPRHVRFSPQDPEYGVAVFRALPPFDVVTVYITRDAGQTWTYASEINEEAREVANVWFNTDASGESALLVATDTYLWKSTDQGMTWEQTALELLPVEQPRKVYDLIAADGKLLLTRHEEDLSIGIYASGDNGTTWERVATEGLIQPQSDREQYQRMAVSSADPKVLYVTYQGIRDNDPLAQGISNVFRSSDGGLSWTPTLFQHPLMERYNITNTTWLTGIWGWQVKPFCINVDPNDPDHVIVSTITAVYMTNDGGLTWRQVQGPTGVTADQPAGGMMMLSCWNYYFSPLNSDRQYIASTDFGGWSSADAGENWTYSYEGNPWHNNIYALAFSPEVEGRLWAASSRTHDIFSWKYHKDLGKYFGGVARSDDGGLTWRNATQSRSLPNRAVTDIWLDPERSVAGAEVLWAAVPGHGLYLSQDGGATWEKRNAGLDTANLNVIRVRGDGEGNLYALSMIRVSDDGREAGSLYVSVDDGQTWEELFTRPEVPHLVNFELVPERPGTIYVTALQKTQDLKSRNGGAWKSEDYGESWTRIYDGPCYALAVHPEDPDCLFLSSWEHMGDGVFTSLDGGATWSQLENYPFWRPLEITFHPENSNRIYVTNFGGGVYTAVLPSAAVAQCACQ